MSNSSNSPDPRPRAAAVLALALVALAAAGCVPRPIPRSLPYSINTVNVPMFDSAIAEVGLEELLTHETVDAFLLDGRVRPVHASRADIVLVGTLTRWNEKTDQLSEDDFEFSKQIDVECRVSAFAPEDTLRQEPIFVWDGIQSSAVFIIDSRFLGEVVPVDTQRILMESLGREVVRSVMEGSPSRGAATEKLEASLDDPGPRYEHPDSLRERRYRQRGRAPLRTAF
jgi:hypothetical protein